MMREAISSQMLLSLLYASPTVFEAVEQMLLPVLVPAPVPAPDLAVSEGVASAAFALLAKLEVDGKQKSPSALKVFRYYCMEGLTAEAVGLKCKCASRTVFRRLKCKRRLKSAAGVMCVTGRFKSAASSLTMKHVSQYE